MMKGKMRWLHLSLVGVLVAATAGCEPKRTAETNAPPAPSPAPPSAAKKLRIIMIPKSKIPYFNACQRGGMEAAQELGDVEFTYDGPTKNDSEAQSRLVDSYSIKEWDVVTIACNDKDQIAPAIKRARAARTHVLTYDSDANPAASKREFFVNQATDQEVAQALMDEMVAQAGPDAEVAVVSSTPTAPNQNSWLAQMETYRKQKYPKLKVLPTEYGGEDMQTSLAKAQAVLNAHPSVKGIWGITSVAFPAVAEAVDRAGKAGRVAVVGLSTPQSMASYVDKGVVKTVILWNVLDLGYLTVCAARAVARGELKAGATSFHTKRLGDVRVQGDQILLGKIMKFTRDNIHQYDF
jgi:rhamnose transport system substrate-binding protein